MSSPVSTWTNRKAPRATVRGRVALVTMLSLLLLAGTSGVAQEAASEESSRLGAQIDKLLERLEEREGEAYWSAVQRIEDLGENAMPIVSNWMGRAGERGRLACAKILLEIGELEDGDKALLVLDSLASKAKDTEVQIAAIRLLSLHGEVDEVQPMIQTIVEKSGNPKVVIAAAKSLWDLNRSSKARDRLVRFLESRDLSTKREAALTLAEMNYFEGEVRSVLRQLKSEPSRLGQRAVNVDSLLRLSRQLDRRLDRGEVVLEGVDPTKLLKIKEERIRELEEAVEKAKAAQPKADASSGGSGGNYAALLEEIATKIQERYVDENKATRERLFKSAIRGMIGDLDPFSSFMDVEDTKTFHESISGEYFGIGAHVNKRDDGPLEIRKILYGGPAHKAGVRSGDEVIKVDGNNILDESRQEVVSKLKGPADTKIVLTIDRMGSEMPLEIIVTRGRVEVPTVYSRLLPQHIGYVRLTKFGDRSEEDFLEALDRLEKAEMNGLVIDLRDNPGGLRETAVRIVDQFVGEEELPILTQKGRTSDETSTAADPFERPNYPIAILVNGSSASASEIVAGALQDYGRAVIVGKRTFGKGSVQQVLQLSKRAASTLGGEARLRLTVQYYFLPLGRCVHTIFDENGEVVERGGIDPDIRVDAEAPATWRLQAMSDLQSNDLIRSYVSTNLEALKEIYDTPRARDPKSFPDFDELYKSLDTKLPEDDVRAVVRFRVRRRVEDEVGRDFAGDYVEDRQLQQAILSVLEARGDKASDLAEYAQLEKWIAATKASTEGEADEPDQQPEDQINVKSNDK